MKHPRIISGAEPFFFPAGQTGCLLVHGLTGTPKEMYWMGEYLSAHGITVLGVRLAGHAPTRPIYSAPVGGTGSPAWRMAFNCCAILVRNFSFAFVAGGCSEPVCGFLLAGRRGHFNFCALRIAAGLALEFYPPFPVYPTACSQRRTGLAQSRGRCRPP